MAPTFSPKARLNVIVEPVHGGPLIEKGGNRATTIGNVPMSKECAMVLFVDRSHQRILLKVPNKLGWKLHYGCDVAVAGHEDHDESQLWSASKQAATASIRESLGTQHELTPSGMMLFTFKDDDHPPMRVRIFETSPPTLDPKLGACLFDFNSVPYSTMWADDIVWLPNLLLRQASYFEAHFVFKGPPGGSSPLAVHAYEKFDT